MVKRLPSKAGSLLAAFLLGCSQLSAFAQSSLDLSSEQRCCGAPQSATIQVGGTNQTIQAGEMITPAQFVAIQQVISTGNQTILLSATGTASGGTLSMSTLPSTGISNLIVPSGVVTLYDSAKAPVLNVTGTLSNSGQFYLFSTDQAVTSATINATNIYNYGLMSSILPQGLVSIPIVSQFSFILNATQNIFNSGVISSAGNLGIIAGNSVINQTLPNASAMATMSAVNNLSVISPNLTNSGNITALTGNLNIGSKLVQDLLINNMQGLLQAAQGQLNINTSPYDAATNVFASGGDLIAKELNIYSPNRAVLESVDISGIANVKAQEATILANNSLTLGRIDVSGDPLLAATGTINLTSQITAGENLSIVAGRDILASGKNVQIDTSSATGSGGDVLMAAGAQYTTTPLGGISITGGTTGGGSIDLNVNNKNYISKFTTTGGGTNASGGNVDMFAFAGTRPGSGQINMPIDVTMTTGGTGTGSSGNVRMIAGTTSTGQGQSAIYPTSINTLGGASGGTIELYAARPQVTSPVNINSTGTVTGGTVVPDTTAGGNLVLGDDISLISRSDITLFGYRDVVLDQGSNPGTGTTISAGVLAPGTSTDTNIPQDKIISSGGVYVRSATKDIVMKRGSSITTVGEDLVLQSGRDINLESDAKVQAFGGDVGLFTDTGHITVDNGSLIKAVGLQTPPRCLGGGVYIWTEVPGMTLSQASSMVQPVWGTFYQQGSVKDVHSIWSPPDPASMGYIEAIVYGDSPDHIQAHQSGFYTIGSDVRGGIISMRTPGEPSSKNILFQKSNVIAINDCKRKPEPPVPPEPPIPPAPPTQAAPKAVVPAQPGQIAGVPTPQVFTMNFEEPTITAAPQYVWTVTYAPPSYLESTAKAKLVVIGGQYVNSDAQGANLLIGGFKVKVNDTAPGGIARAQVIVREQQKDSTCGAIALGAASKDPVTVSVTGRKYKLFPGAMLLISRDPSAELADVACVTPLTTTASLPESIPRMVLMQTQEVPLRNQLPQTYEAQQTGVAQNPRIKAEAVHLSNLRPVAALSTGGRPVTNFPGTCFLRNAQVQQVDKHHYIISKGNLLASLNDAVQFETPHGTVTADKGSVIMLYASQRLTRVKNFSDRRQGSVRLATGQSTVTVEPGKEYNVSRMKSNVTELVLSDGLARRNIIEKQAGQIRVVTADFSILHALLNQPLMVEMRSSDSTTAVKILDEILKTAASLNLVVDRYKGPYYAPPRSTTGGIAGSVTEMAL